MLKFEEISPADFFYRNKEIAGFENPVKACYTVVRELVENSLDACEAGNILPDIELIIREENNTNFLNKEEGLIKIRITDNGIGVPAENVPYAFGRVLYSSKYTMKQHRGIFGLGGKMAILYGQITTNSPVSIFTATIKSKIIHYFELFIDIQRNEPIIKRYQKIENTFNWHGLSLEFKFLGNYKGAKKKIFDYLYQTSIITPYLNLVFIDSEGNSIVFERKVNEILHLPKDTLLHPKGIDMEILKRLINANKKLTLIDFLVNRFQRIGYKTAQEILKIANIENKIVGELNDEEIQKIYEILKTFNFKKPDPRALAPVGENLVIGIKEIFDPEIISYNKRKPSSYEGHPFIVETAIAYGGKIPIPQNNEINLFRFANKIPLIYDSYNDVSMKVIKDINWNVYKINIYQEPIAFFVHICSTKIPYKTLGKEYIANIPEIYKEIENSLRKNARQISAYLNKKRLLEYQKIRKLYIKDYLKKIVYFASDLAEVKIDIDNYLKNILKDEE